MKNFMSKEELEILNKLLQKFIAEEDYRKGEEINLEEFNLSELLTTVKERGNIN